MILNIPENRQIIIQYLESINEDTFIDDFIIPFFRSHGFQVFRTNSHGPGEHGKDIIFCRYMTMYLENEFIVVQAKAEALTTSNVTRCSDQIKRALNISFPQKSGAGAIKPHMAVFINARKHSNDANAEFPQLTENSPHIKILSQENVCDLIMNSVIAPRRILDQLSLANSHTTSEEDRLVYKTLMDNNPAEVDKLLDHGLQLIKNELSTRSKVMVIDYVFNRWKQDPSWDGTVKPMKWLDKYFDFFSTTQYDYLFDVFGEATSSTPSFEAEPFTRSICTKVTPAMLMHNPDRFIQFCARAVLSYGPKNKDMILNKLNEFISAPEFNDPRLKDMGLKVIAFNTLGRKDKPKYDQLHEEIYKYVWLNG